MAGGKGTRLKPLTCGIPKPMVPILNKPVMEYSIELFKKYNINDIGVTLAYLPTVITDYFHTGAEWGVNLNYYIEDTPLGTGGSVKNAEDLLDNTFVVISGDALTDINLDKAIQYHKEKKSKATLVLKKEEMPLEYGVVITDEDGRIIRFLEKPSWSEVFSNTVNTGIYILEPEVLNYYSKGDQFDFSKDLFPQLLKDNIPLYGYITEDYWNDIGDLDSYMKTQFDILDKKVNVPIQCKEIKEGIWIDEGTKIKENVTLLPPIYISKNCTIESFAEINPYTYVGENCVIGEGVNLKRSIIWKNTKIETNAHLSGTTVCGDVQIKENVNIYEHTSIGNGCEISKNATVKPNTLIWPDKLVEENMIVNQHIIWGTKCSKTIFGNRDISGEINIDITPEFSSRLGSAFASNLDTDSTIVVTSDKSYSCNIIKNSIISGVLSTGSSTIDIKNATMGMNRYAVRYYNADGGIHIRVSPFNKNIIHIEFTDKNGSNIDRNTERKIENLFVRDDFRRCSGEKIKDNVDIANFSALYIKNGSNLISDISQIKRRNPKVIISSMNKNVMDIAFEFLEYIGCQVQCEYSSKKYNNISSLVQEISNTVIKEKAELGIVYSDDGEKFILIDEQGRIINEEMYISLSTLILLKLGYRKIIVPYTATYTIENLAKNYSGEIIRTKTSPADVMNEMFKYDDKIAFLQYVLQYDGILAVGKIIDFITSKDINIGDLIREIPKFYMIKKEIQCEWRDKGRVIKEMIINHGDCGLELFEGVKINNDKGWALILPDNERSIFNIFTEGDSEEYASELSTQFIDKVKKILKTKE